MASKTLVGALNMLGLLDTTQFTAELKRTGERAKAFSVKVRGNMNAISGSITELSSKLGIVSNLIRTAGVAAGAFSGALKLLSSDAEEFGRGLDMLDMSLRKIPFGLGEVYGMFYDLDILGLGAQARELEAFAEAERKHNAERMAMVAEFERYASGSTSLNAALRKAREEQAIANSVSPERDRIRFERSEALRKIEAERDRMLAKDKANEQAILEVFEQQKKVIIETFLTRLDTLQQGEERKRIEYQIAEQARKQAASAKEAAEAAKAAVASKQKEQRIRERMAEQEKRIASIQGENVIGATTSISTALGAITVADTSGTKAIQQRQLDNIKEQTQILRDIRQELTQGEAVFS